MASLDESSGSREAAPGSLLEKDLPPIPEFASAETRADQQSGMADTNNTNNEHNVNGTNATANDTANSPARDTGNDVNGPTASLLNGAPTDRLPVGLSPGPSPKTVTNGAGQEASDYLNGGLPHAGNAPSPVGLANSDIDDPDEPNEGTHPRKHPKSPIGGNDGQGGAPESPPATPGVESARRKSVQFSRADVVIDAAPPAQTAAAHLRQGSWETGSPSRSRAFMSRLKALAAQGGLPTPKSPGMQEAAGYPSSTASLPTRSRGSPLARGREDRGDTNDTTANPNAGSNADLDTAEAGADADADVGTDGDADADADAEETADEASVAGATSRPRRRRRRMRHHPRQQGSVTAPVSAVSTNDGIPTEPNSPLPSSRHVGMLPQRRATMPEHADQPSGLSEGEGRDRHGRRRPLRRGSSWVSRNETLDDGPSTTHAPPGRALGHVRRMTVFGGGVSDGDAMTPRRTLFAGDRAATFGAQKWRQVKNTLKLLRQRREDRFDYLKSAELMAELRAGAPAVLMLASMIQRDEHGNKRIPVLLEQVKVHIRDSAPMQDGDSERHWLFTIDLEYGSGPSRMRWTIKRTIREILELHWKYKLALRNDKYLHTTPVANRPKQPRFPISAFPYVRGLRGVEIDEDEDDAASIRCDEPTDGGAAAAAGTPDGNATGGEATGAEGTATEAEGAAGNLNNTRRRKSRIAVLGISRRSSVATGTDGLAAGDGGQLQPVDEAAVRRKYVERQQRMLEKYLNEMIHWLIFRADSNRLCRFLELSALGVRLAAEGSYHGKECFLHIQSSKGLDFRRVLTPGKVIERHSRKWFLVRQSYIVCVESPENMNIYDVYLVDPKFSLISKKNKRNKQLSPPAATQEKHGKQKGKAPVDPDMPDGKPHLKHHTLTILTSERKVKLWARSQPLVAQFEESILDMLKQTPWHRRNRFDSFAPVRTGVFAQWLVDGRDYMWNVSRAIAMAKDVIYIHDWWLSPELYMRRPACISQKWRLDRLLQRKASEGVKIFVIVYRNVEAAIPIDSEYTKFSLLNLHPNIFVQRSPNQFKKNQFFFAHHEKICIVDHDVAFVGGIDLCFGRWDSPQHSLVDDKPTGFELDAVPKDADHCQLWPGKDYSNPRVQDFFSLREPYKEMYDRTKVPRMPWHDVGMQIVGQPARDLTRHFVQRWNYVRRGRKPTRPTPFLLPPPDYQQEDLENLGLSGTCEVQILRSASAWSLGITDVECSIQTAYISMIEESEHFVYMENQFFITSTETLNVKIVNRIGDALVDRITRAYQNDEDWRCVIIIPLMPGFQNSVADQEGTSVRLILQCQYRSICRGENSIFGRLRAAGIEPEEYIQFFSLRQWGRINNKTVLTTEQLYIHAKTIIVDDRVALIGSANINERSLLGDRDSEVAAIVRDRDMIESTMAGMPYRVGRFAHTLRLRLMQEHLGLDTDEIMEDAQREAEFEADMDSLYSGENGGQRTEAGGNDGDHDNVAISPSDASEVEPAAKSSGALNGHLGRERTRGSSYNHDVDLEGYGTDRSSARSRRTAKAPRQAADTQLESASGSKKPADDVEGGSDDHWTAARKKGIDRLRDSTVVNGREVLVDGAVLDSAVFDHGGGHIGKNEAAVLGKNGSASQRGRQSSHGRDRVSHTSTGGEMPTQEATDQTKTSIENPLPPIPTTDDTPGGSEDPTGRSANPLAADIRLAQITKDCMRDPLDPAFYDDVWSRVAENNTKIFRRVFRCLPDSEVTNWHEFQEFIAYAARFQESMEQRRRGDDSTEQPRNETGATTAASTASRGFLRSTAGGGAGISVPAPAAIEAVALVGEKVASAVLHHHKNAAKADGDKTSSGQSRPATGGSGGPVPPLSSGGEVRLTSRADMERAAAAENAFKRRPSSVAGSLVQHVAPASPRGPPTPTAMVEDADDGMDQVDRKENGTKETRRRTTFSAQEKPPRPLTGDKDDRTNGSGVHGNANGSSGSRKGTGASSNSATMAVMPTPTTGMDTTAGAAAAGGSVKRRRRATTRASRRGFQGSTEELLSRADAEELVSLLQGQLVQFPYDWLLVEEGNGNWLYQVDQVAPLQIYN